MKKFFISLLTWIWCFPQMFLGLIVKLITKAQKCGEYYEFNIKGGSLSLGTYIFICPAHHGDGNTLKHEQGHTKQSYILGWLYLLVIGLPSLIWAKCFGWYRRKYNVSYFSLYTEKWADKLSGIERN